MGELREGRKGVDRRAFLTLASLGSGAAAVALAVDTGSTEAAEEPAATSAGYAETAHVRAYYDSTRI